VEESLTILSRHRRIRIRENESDGCRSSGYTRDWYQPLELSGRATRAGQRGRGGKGGREGRKGKLTREEVGLPTTIPPHDNIMTRSDVHRNTKISSSSLAELGEKK